MNEGLHPGLHPGPDALNAFVEGALPEHERVDCLAHLSDCAQCREVVFFAQKAAQLEEPVRMAEPVVAREAPVSLWRRLLKPIVIVPVVAAAIVVALSLGLYQRFSERQPRTVASTAAPVETAPPAPATAATGEKQNLPPPQVRPAMRKAGPLPAPKQQEQPAASLETAPAPAAPLAVASEPPPPRAPAPVIAAAPVAQEGGVTGTIFDPAGAVIAGAQVELRNEGTGITFKSASDAGGSYTVAELPPGRYEFSVTGPGFKKTVRPNIDVLPQMIARVDSMLQIGQADQSVTITAEAPALKTESGELSHNVALDFLDALPLLTLPITSFEAVIGSSPVYTLPDKSAPVSIAAKDPLVVAVDSAGALFVSKNDGRSWTRIKAAWKGKVVRVSVTANAMFELTTDPASTWVSADGVHWSKAPKKSR